MRKIIFAILIVGLTMSAIGITSVSGDTPQEIYWTGQTIEISDNVSSNNVYGIYNATGDDNDLVQQVVSNNSGGLEIDTENYQENNFEIYEQESGKLILEYEQQNQDFSVDTNVTEAIDENVNYTLNSKRGKFDVEVSSESMDDQQLSDALQVADSRIDDTEEGFIINDANQGEEIILDTTPIEEGNYELKWNVTDTVDEFNVSLFTQDIPPTSVNFNSSTYSTTLNEKVGVSMELEYRNEVNVTIGRDVYSHNVILRDDDNDDEVSFTFDTSKAGNGSKPVDSLDGTEITEQKRDENLSVDSLASISYTIEATVGDDDSSSYAVLNVVPPNLNGIETYVYPGDGAPRDIEDLRSDAMLSDTVSMRDYIAFRVDVTSIYTYLDKPVNGSNIKEGGKLDQNFGARMTLEELNPSPNQDPDKYNLSNAPSVYIDETEQELWVAVSAGDLVNYDDEDKTEIETIDAYNATFEINSSENDVFDDDQEVNATVSIQNAVAVPQNDRTEELGSESYILDMDEPQVVLETSLAEGRSITILADEFGEEFLVFDTQQVEDGTVTFDAESNSLDNDTEFTLDIPTTGHSYEFVTGSNNVAEEYNIPSQVMPGEEFEANATIRDEIPDDDIDTEWDISNAEVLGENTYRYSESFAPGNVFDANLTLSSDDQRYFEQINEEITLVSNNSVENGNQDGETDYDLPDINASVSKDSSDPILEGDMANFESNVTEPRTVFVDYTWTVDGEEQIDTNQPEFSYQFDTPGSVEVGVDVTTVEGKTTTKKIDVRVYESNQQVRSMYEYLTN